MSIGFEILIIALLIFGNGIFAMSEMAVITARKSRLQDWVKKGNSRAKVALELAQTPNRFLSSVQIGITLIGILAGVFAGRGVAAWMADYLQSLPLVGVYHRQIGLGLVVLIITFFSLDRRAGAQASRHAPSGNDRDLGRAAAALVRAPGRADGALAERFDRSYLPAVR